MRNVMNALRNPSRYFRNLFGRSARPFPHLFPLVRHLGRSYGCSNIIAFGCEYTHELLRLRGQFNLTVIDSGERLKPLQARYPDTHWIECDFDHPEGHLELDPLEVSASVVICAGVIEQLEQPEYLLNHLHALLDTAPVAVLVTRDDEGRWGLDELVELTESHGIHVEFSGHTLDSDLGGDKTSKLVIMANNRCPPRQTAPEDFRVVAVMFTYNEADIIDPSIQFLTEQGITVYIIDNWSDDGTDKRARELSGQGVVGFEYCPPVNASGKHVYNRIELLTRVEALAQEIAADWLILYDVDERRESPWPQISLKDAIYYVDQCGFNCVDHTLIEFKPVDNHYPAGTDFDGYFQHFIFGQRIGHFIQIKAWKCAGQPVALVANAGHRVQFANQRVYPYKFLLKHYPLRSKAQSVGKIRARQNDVSAHARSMGWHTMYDNMNLSDDKLFEQFCDQNRIECAIFDPASFYSDWLVERLTGIGLIQKNKPFLSRLRHKAYSLARSWWITFVKLSHV